ncbi:MAG: 1,4-dihydroxy-2-naphthoate octaprenyltransferase [Thiotrichales bacterium]|jgi:1,4-dihydroxy-2-naphthoate octaprenyltransferase|nr:1,4-dihydroxy-2-naphthoate octaprenyltransferase [Thiotrichales bacterium]MBT3613887.1 1,4-dihydroxy-2-naphthoate octaprenyltransferase [Thiotrichales bacterium]MBT3752963.1 1,4-dihydroxy-2-naphthoate octaprenyltransferase [Thiotrichales bacterium]MBT3838181.1 1,4-dihydroxy-2-naphthoate octaprenyltransferase [Thiotrichales bacterium]MBT4151819.1 1,4-dihydroxy-2-naphthoate octaprenyltransferase [Thiotrichales bacterium]
MNYLNPWILALRPKTVTMSLVPVAVGAVVAVVESGNYSLDYPLLGVIFITALLIQIGTNLYNDAGDALRGADGEDRLGPVRVVSSGLLPLATVQRVAKLSFFGALLSGCWLVWVGGLPILTIGILSIGAGIAYTGGSRPIAYTIFGELFVFLFFGLAAVMGTTYLLIFSWSMLALLLGSALGMLAAAVLVVNNYRDIDGDSLVGKNTLAVKLGKSATRILYLFLIFTPFILVQLFADLMQGIQLQLIWLAFPFALYLGREIYRTPHGVELNRVLELSVKLQLLFAILIILGVLL